MTSSLAEKIWDDVSEKVGEDLRAVTRYKAKEFETVMRDDVRERYTTNEDQAVVDHTIINQLSLSDIENAFKTGPLEGFVRVFGDAWVLSWPDKLPGKSGVLISIQRGGSTASADDIEWCFQYLKSEIAPLIDSD